MTAPMNENPNAAITTDDLHAYVDGHLLPERAEQVEAYLAAHPEAAAEVADYRRINAALHESFDGVFDEPVPSAHADLIRRRRPLLGFPMAAAIAGLIVGVGAGWFAHGLGSADRAILDQLAESSSAAYVVYSPEKRHPVEVTAADDVHLSAWLSNRMGMSLPIPKLNNLGFELVGGRLMVSETSPAALLMYENDDGRRVVLYVRNDLRSTDSTDMQFARKGEAGVVTWADGASGFGLAGGFSEQELLPAAHLIRAQLSL